MRKKTNPLFKKLKGFQKSPRARFLLISKNGLSQEEFLLYELAIAITDWDESHIETYGSFEATNQDLSEVLGWEADTTALRHRKSLIKKKILTIREDGRIEPRGFEKWKIRNDKSANSQESTAKITDSSVNMQMETANIQEDQAQNTDDSLVSFKGSVGSFEENNYISEEELDQIEELVDALDSLDKQ